MPGTIRTKEKCPTCGKDFSIIPRLGIGCKKCLTTPRKFFLDFSWNGSRKKIYSDKSGRALDSYAFAQEILAVIHSEIKAKTFDPSKYFRAELVKFYFEYVAGVWLADKEKDVKKKLLANSYLKELKAYNERHFKFFKGRDIRDIRRVDIDNFKDALPSHLSPKTIKNIFIALKNLFMVSLQKEIIDRVPSFPKIDVPEYSGWQWIDSETQALILSKLRDIDRAIFAFMFLHGVRPGEARALKVKDINLKANLIRIRRTWSLNELRETTKQKKINVIPINPGMYGYLSAVASSSLPEAFVFPNRRTSRAYSEDSLRKSWKRALAAAGIREHIRLYDGCRHSYASQLVNSNIPINIVSRLLGHSSVKMTARYAHQDILSLRAAISAISLPAAIPTLAVVKK